MRLNMFAPLSSAADVEPRSSLAAVHLRCEHVAGPLGVQTPAPLLSWELRSPRRGARQTALQILAASAPELCREDDADLWDSGKMQGTRNFVLYGNPAPHSGQRVSWRVRVWDEADQPSAWSEPAGFEFGLLNPHDWEGEWIGAGETECAPCFRREFQAKEGLCRARAYFSGLGYGELYLNGTRAGDAQLTPGWTDYDQREYRDLYYPYEDRAHKRVLYTISDVTSLIRPGRNALGCILGNGMHNQRTRVTEGKMGYGPPRMLLNLVLEYADGTRERIVSNGTWKWAEGPIRYNQMFAGERYDARLALPETWLLPGFTEEGWSPVLSAPRPAGELHAQIDPPDRILASLPPAAQTEPQPGVFVFDFGRVISGWVQITVSGKAGQRVTLRFSEELAQDGTPDFRSAGATSRTVTGEPQIQTDEYILGRRGVETYAPRFVWHAFRYAEVTGWPGGAPSEGAVLAQVVHMDIPASGAFDASNPLFPQINATFRATQLANWHSGVLSDCPHRERLGYTGDGQIACEAAMWNFQAAPFYAKWIADIFDAQNQASGFIPHTVPFYGGGGGYGWGAAGVIIPWMFAKFYGDTRVLRRHYPQMKLWMDYIERHCDARGVVTHEEPESWCLGDWAFPEAPSEHFNAPVPRELVNTFYYGHCTRLMSEIAGVLGEAADARAFTSKLERIRADFHQAFYDAQRGCYAEGRAGANAFALTLGAVPPEEKARAIASMREYAQAFDTGIFGTPILLDALTEHDAADRAEALLAGTAFPSLGFMLANGATTLWESWSKETGSHCHPMFGSVCAWFYRVVAGLEQAPDSFGFERLIWRPGRVGEFAQASFHSPRGIIAVEWRKTTGSLLLNAELPPGSTMHILFTPDDAPPAARLFLDGAEYPMPDSSVEIGSGSYALELRN